MSVDVVMLIMFAVGAVLGFMIGLTVPADGKQQRRINKLKLDIEELKLREQLSETARELR